MQSRQKKLSFFHFELLDNIAPINLRREMIQNLFYWIAGDIDPITGDTFSDKIFATTLSVRHKYVALAIDNPAIVFFGCPVIVGPVAGLHVEYPHAHTLGHDSSQA